MRLAQVIKIRSWWVVMLMMAAVLYPLWPNLLDPHLPATSEVFRYGVLGDLFYTHLMRDGAFPRWIPEMNGGFGYPQFVFYQPGYFFLQSLVSPLTDHFMGRQLLTLVGIALVGAVGCYRLLRQWVRPGVACLLLLAFVAAPYSRINLFLRGDLSEWLCQQWLPWVLLFMVRFLDQRSVGRAATSPWWGLAISLAILIYAHPMALLFVPPLLFFTLLFRVWGEDVWAHPAGWRWRLGLEWLGAVLLAFFLSGPYWVSVVVMKPWVMSEARYEHWPKAWENAAPLWSLLWGSFHEAKPFQETEFLGLPFVVAALWGAWRGRRDPWIRAAGCLYLLMMVLMSPLARWFWHWPPFSMMQFPWRLALFAPVLQVLCCLGFWRPEASSARYRAARGLLLGVLGGWVMLSPYQYRPWTDLGLLNQQDLLCFRDFTGIARPGSYPATLDTGEWLPKTAAGILALPARGESRTEGCADLQQRAGDMVRQIYGEDPFPLPIRRPLVEFSSASWRVVPDDRAPGIPLDIVVEGDRPVDLIINQLYFPGWQLAINGEWLDRSRLEQQVTADGRIGWSLEAGRWRLQARYAGPLSDRWVTWVMALAVGVAGLYWSWPWRVGRDRLTRNSA
jgi:hypothetical protein